MRRRIILLLMAVVLLGGVSAGYLWYNAFAEQEKPIDGQIEIDSPSGGLENRVSVLLIGADQRPEQTVFNTDSLIFTSVDPETKQISMLSIPRDTRVALTGHGHVKINEVASLTDIQTLQKNVAQLTGEKIAGYVQTNFSGFKKIIDTLGGITVDVEKKMYFETGDDEDGYIDLEKGVQRLDGSQALQYARFRNDALGDISRTARQQIVLKAVAKEMFKLSTLPKLPWLIPQLMDAVKTNLSLKDILLLTKVAVQFDSANVITQTLPGEFQDINGISYWKVDPIEVKEVVRNLFLGITTDKVIDESDVDLLKPIIVAPKKPLPKVPGNTQDPNGQKSPGHEVIAP